MRKDILFLSICFVAMIDALVVVDRYGNKESVGARGITLHNDQESSLSSLCQVIKELKIKKVVELHCGISPSYYIADITKSTYIGVDHDAWVIKQNRERFSQAHQSFLCLDLYEDSLPKGDLILCPDLFERYDQQSLSKILKNIKATGSTFLIADIEAASRWQGLPQPIVVMNKKQATERSLGLWLLSECEPDSLVLQSHEPHCETKETSIRTKSPRILHLTFHLGCVKEVEYVAEKLGLDVTSWYIFDKPLSDFEGCNSGLEVYNMLPDRAQRIWEKHKDYFNSFDIIWTSDTAALSRIFLQNNWSKPLLVWICNRFDYSHYPSEFPDPAYYELFRKATTQKNVFIVPYSPYEWYHAYTKKVYLNTFTIKPVGAVEQEMRYVRSEHSVPASVDKQNRLLIYPRLNQTQLSFVKNKCDELQIPYYSGPYNGSHDIKDFKGIIFFIYGAWLNVAMFENFQRGLVHFLPSIRFMEELDRTRAPVSGHPYVLGSKLYELCDWYSSEHKDLIVYYDSWEDLKHKVETTDYKAMKEKIIAFSQQHEQEMIERWRKLFVQIYQQV